MEEEGEEEQRDIEDGGARRLMNVNYMRERNSRRGARERRGG